MTHDKAGRPYLKLEEAKDKMVVELDEGFSCHVSGKAILYKDEAGAFFYCMSGRHDIDSQADDGIHCVGIYSCP